MQRFETLGIHPRGKLGQNFLIDLNLLHLLHESAQLDKNDVVLEVGTGTGSLTGAMALEAGRVVTVEVDPTMHEMAKQEHWDKDNIRFLFADILENKNRLNRDVLNVLREELANNPGFRFKLCANLPYQIATPLMSNLLLTDIPPHSMTVTIQKEVGDRIVARPRTKDLAVRIRHAELNAGTFIRDSAVQVHEDDVGLADFLVIFLEDLGDLFFFTQAFQFGS